MTTRLSERAAAERLEALERRFGLYDLKLGGWVAWRAIRGPVAFVLNGYSVTQQSAASRGVALFPIAIEAARFVGALLRRRRQDVLMKTLASAVCEAQGDKLRDIYFDSLLVDGLDAHKVHQQNSTRMIRREQMLYPYATAHSSVAALSHVLAALWVSAETKRVAGRICEALATLEQETVTYGWVARRLESIRWQAWLYGLLLKAVRPRSALVADAGEYALNIACKRNRVTFVEIQHGVFTENHPDAIPAWALEHATAAELILPDVLGVFGEYWARRLCGTALGRQRLVPVGSDVVDRWRQRRNDKTRTLDAPLSIVVTTQGQERAGLIAWLQRAIEGAPKARRWRMIIKLHPVYDRDPELYAALRAHPGVEVAGQEATRSVYELLVEADAHASISSATHFDAIGLGVPTVVIPLPGSELVMDMVDGRRVFRGDDPSLVWNCAGDSRQPVAGGGEDLYAAGFVGRVRGIVA